MKRPIGEWPYDHRPERVAFKIVEPLVLRLLFNRHYDWPIAISDNSDCCQFDVSPGVTIAGGAIERMPPPFDHVGEAAFLVTPFVRGWVPDIYYAARDMIQAARDKRDYRRVQCHVAADDPLQVAFAERLGFVHEGRLLRMGPDATDMHIMRWEPWQQ